MKYSFAVWICFLCAGVAGFAGVSHAQFNKLLPISINIAISPENPAPNQEVSATLTSFDTNLDAAVITWMVNGSTKKSGRGIKTFTFTTGSLSADTTLSILVETAEGDTVSKSVTIRPTEVDLVWEAKGWTPPFYKGKTLFSHQDQIRFIALPHITSSTGAEIPPKSLIYTWTKNGTIIQDASGYGKNLYGMTGSLISRPLDVRVEVTAPDSSSVGAAEVNVSPIEPIVLLYEKDPLYGVQFQKSLDGTITLSDSKEIEVFGAPFFFGETNGTDSSLLYTWNINNAQIDNDTTRTSRVFRQVEGTSGTSYISLSVNHAQKILQSASRGFNLEFGKSQTAQTP